MVGKFFKKHTKDKKFDLIIHCAYKDSISSAKLLDPTYNIGIMFNLLNNKKYFSKLINIGSGAEFDKQHPIHDKVNNLNTSYPLETYSMGKNITARVIAQEPDCYNLRVFGCFGLNEKNTRFFVKNIINYIKSKPIEIYQDKFFDFFNIKDLLKVINYYIKGMKENYPLEKEIDLVYTQKIKLSDVANIINNLSKEKVDITINNPKLGNSYTGSKLGVPYDIEFDGIKKGIMQMYNTLSKDLK